MKATPIKPVTYSETLYLTVIKLITASTPIAQCAP
jgi:hypothetical protein